MDEESVRRSLAGERSAAKKKRPRFGPKAMAKVVTALRGGATFAEAARKAGFKPATVHKWRRKSDGFAAACADAVAESDAPVLVVPGSGGRRWQVRRERRHRFTAERKQAFLEHFAATLDLTASAEAAGVCFSTVYEHRRTDPAFADGCREAVEIGVARLEAEAVRQRLAAMEKIRVSGDKEVPGAGAEFDRTMAFLRTWKSWMAGDKRGGPPLTKWSFEKSLEELEKALKAFGVRIGREEGKEEAPPPSCGRSPSPGNPGEDLEGGGRD